MENERPNVTASGPGSVAVGGSAGPVTVNNYLANKGVKPFMVFRGDPSHPLNEPPSGIIEVSALRKDIAMIEDPREWLPHATPVRIHGTLYPCALLVSGWWVRKQQEQIEVPQWDNDIQAWLFHGFHEWGPSWDFTWDFENMDETKIKPYLIAQLGDGDEANSIPVIIPHEKAKRLHEIFLEKGNNLGIKVGGFEVEIKGLLTHRIHFTGQELESFDLPQEDILNYCIWLKEGEAGHVIKPLSRNTDIYSGYLWKLIAPQKWVEGKKTIPLNQVYFVWEHTNFFKQDSVKYNLDSLEHKVSYIKKIHKEKYGEDDFVLLQKSSSLVPDKPKWKADEFYDFFLGKTGEAI